MFWKNLKDNILKDFLLASTNFVPITFMWDGSAVLYLNIFDLLWKHTNYRKYEKIDGAWFPQNQMFGLLNGLKLWLFVKH